MRTKFSDLIRNDNGKTSGSGFVGVLAGTVCTLVILAGAILAFMHSPDAITIIDKALMGLTLSAALLGLRKMSKSNNTFATTDEKDKEVKQENKSDNKDLNDNNI